MVVGGPWFDGVWIEPEAPFLPSLTSLSPAHWADGFRGGWLMEVHSDDPVCLNCPLEGASPSGVNGPKDPGPSAMVDCRSSLEGGVRRANHVVRAGAVADGQRQSDANEVLPERHHSAEVFGLS